MPESNKTRPGPYLYLLMLVGSMLITVWSVYADPVINIDGILYIKAAQALAGGDLSGAFLIYKWPFYPALIYLVHSMTGLDLFISANVINGVFNFLTCVAFVWVVAALGGTRRTLLIAALVIVLFPGLNEVRSYIIRDHAYIVFYLLSFYFLILALRAQPLALLMSLGAMAIATIFRIEGAVYLAVIPYIYLYCRPVPFFSNRASLITVTIALIILLIPMLGWWLHNPEKSVLSITDLSNNWHYALKFLDTKVQIIKYKLLKTSSSSVARMVYLWVVVGAISAQVLAMFTLPYAVLAGYALKKRLVFPNAEALRPWKLFIYFNVVILLLFTLVRFILTDRYPLSLAVLLLLVVPFALEHLYEKWKSADRTWPQQVAYGLLALVLVLNCMEGLTSYTNKRYLAQSGLWLQKNLPKNASLYTNNQIVSFYSAHADKKTTIVEGQDELINELYRGEWINHDYLALNLPSDPELDKALKVALWVVPEKVFRNKKNDQVRIYNIKMYRAQEAKKGP